MEQHERVVGIIPHSVKNVNVFTALDFAKS